MKFKTKIHSHQRNIFSTILLPVAWIKDRVEEIYLKLLSVIFAELIKGKRDAGFNTNLIALICFIIFSLLFYHFKYLEPVIFFLFLIIWVADQLITRIHFNYLKSVDTATITSADHENFTWTILGKQHGKTESFTKSDVQMLVIQNVTLAAGAFEESNSYAWQLLIRLNDQRELAIAQNLELEPLWILGNGWAEFFQVTIQIDDSIRFNRFVKNECTFSMKKIVKSKISITSDELTTTIRSKINLKSIGDYLGQLFSQSGILLFIVISAAVMERSGHFITAFFGHHVGLYTRTPLVLNFSLYGIYQLFKPDLLDLIQFCIAVFCMLVGGMNLYRSRKVDINAEKISYIENGDAQGEMSTATINNYIIIEEPDLKILVMSPEGVLEIGGFSNLDECYAWLYALDETELLPEAV